MWYLIEEYRWDCEGDIRYYHLADSKLVRSTSLKDGEYKDGSLFEITKVEDDEVKRTRSRKRRDE
jgi:hypothetical protein